MSKVMIIDDSRTILKISKDIIEKNLDDIEVITVIDSEEGMERLLAEVYQVVILDILMPKTSGIDVLKWIKAQPSLKYLKVIMFTALNDSEALTECFSLGAYDFIRKPLESNEFIARLNHALNEYLQESIIQENYKKLKAMNNELLELNDSLKEAQLEIVQKDRLVSIGHLAAGMAHEINNPLGFLGSNLTAMEGNTCSLLELYDYTAEKFRAVVTDQTVLDAINERELSLDYQFIKEDSPELINDIKYGLRRINVIIEDLRKFSALDSGSGNEPVWLESSLDNIVAMIDDTLSDSITVVIDIDIQTPIIAKKADINLALHAIIDNAVNAIQRKISPKPGEIRIFGKENETNIILEIGDNGVGMSSEVLKHSMDPFFTTEDVGEGVGLGLSAAYNCFTNLINGKMTIESEPDVGTKVHLILPREVR